MYTFQWTSGALAWRLNNEVNRTKLSLSLSSPLSSHAIFITCHVQLYVPGAVYRLEILKKAESSLIDYSYKATTNCIVVSRPGYGYNSVRAGGDFYYSLWMW